MTGPISATPGRPTLIYGNWKASPPTAQQAERLAVGTAGRLHRLLQDDTSGKYHRAQVGVFVPSIYLPFIGNHMVFQPYHNSHETKWSDCLLLGVQSMSPQTETATTGEITPQMIVSCFDELKRAGMVLVGHADRREAGETNTTVNQQMHAAYNNNLRPVMCIGEQQTQREAGQTKAPLTLQLSDGLRDVGLDAFMQAGTVIAYQPRIIKDKPLMLTRAAIDEAHAHIRSIILSKFGHKAADRTPIIYGGDVDPETARAVLAEPNVDGLLVEEPSLDADRFIEFVKSVPV